MGISHRTLLTQRRCSLWLQQLESGLLPTSHVSHTLTYNHADEAGKVWSLAQRSYAKVPMLLPLQGLSYLTSDQDFEETKSERNTSKLVGGDEDSKLIQTASQGETFKGRVESRRLRS